MGKATISTEIGFGEYTIVLNFDITRLLAKNITLDAEIISINATISSLNGALAVLQNEKQVRLAQLNSDISTARAATPPGNEFTHEWQVLLTAATKDVVEIDGAISSIEWDIARLNARKVSIVQELKSINNAISDYENPIPVEAWCADYTLGLTGEIGTIELNDETNSPERSFTPHIVLLMPRISCSWL